MGWYTHIVNTCDICDTYIMDTYILCIIYIYLWVCIIVYVCICIYIYTCSYKDTGSWATMGI